MRLCRLNFEIEVRAGLVRLLDPFNIPKPRMRYHTSAVGIAAILIVLTDIHAQTATVSSSTEKAAVDALIPWLLQEDAQLRGIPFSEVIFDVTGKRVLACNPKDETNARVLKQISSVLDEVMARLNAPESPIQGIPRINEVSSHFEDLMRELLNKTPGLACDFPKTATGGKQRSGYPDLELVDQLSHRVYYLDPKLYAVGSRDSSFRTFYFEPKTGTNKVRDDAVHFVAGFEHEAVAASRSRGASDSRLDTATEHRDYNRAAVWKF